MSSQLIWTPRDESTAETITLAGIAELDGARTTETIRRVSVGGSSFSQALHSRGEYKLRAVAELATVVTWFRWTAFVAHADAGGQFAVKVETAKDEETQLDGSHTQGDVIIAVDDTTGFSGSDRALIIDALDPTKYQVCKINTVDSGTQVTLNAATALVFSFADDSTLRHWEYLPQCVLRPGTRCRFSERAAPGQLWDLEFDLIEVT